MDYHILVQPQGKYDDHPYPGLAGVITANKALTNWGALPSRYQFNEHSRALGVG